MEEKEPANENIPATKKNSRAANGLRPLSERLREKTKDMQRRNFEHCSKKSVASNNTTNTKFFINKKVASKTSPRVSNKNARNQLRNLERAGDVIHESKGNLKQIQKSKNQHEPDGIALMKVTKTRNNQRNQSCSREARGLRPFSERIRENKCKETRGSREARGLRPFSERIRENKCKEARSSLKKRSDTSVLESCINDEVSGKKTWCLKTEAGGIPKESWTDVSCHQLPEENNNFTKVERQQLRKIKRKQDGDHIASALKRYRRQTGRKHSGVSCRGKKMLEEIIDS